MITLYIKTRDGRTIVNLANVDKITFAESCLMFHVTGADYPMSFRLNCDHDTIWARIDKMLSPLHEGRHMNVVLKLSLDLSDLQDEATF